MEDTGDSNETMGARLGTRRKDAFAA